MPATEKQLEANRANAQFSTGPASEDGKARASRNALRHGLTCRDLHVPAGQREDFEEMKQDLLDELTPNGVMETLFFNQILSATWRLRRCDWTEAALAARTTEPDPLLDPALAPTLRTINTARSTASRDLHKATAELRKLQTERQYRVFVMSDEELSYDLGIADWQTIRRAHGKELALETSTKRREMQNTLTAATHDIWPVEGASRPNYEEIEAKIYAEMAAEGKLPRN